MLTVLLATILTSSIFTRPTQAEFLNTVGTTVGCLINVGTCPPPVVDPNAPTNPGENTNPEEETDPEEIPIEDAAAPTGTLSLNLTLAGGTTQIVTISGSVSDDNLASYVLKLNDNVVQEVTGITETTATISVPWNVAAPNKVPSGIYTVTLDITDKAGNVFRAEPVTVEVDNDGPKLSIAGGDIIIKSGSIIPEVVADDPRGIGAYQWRAGDDNPAILEYKADAKDPVFTPTVQGSYTYYLDVTDGLGNVSSGIFEFDYAQQLATVPLPVVDDPSDKLINQNPSTPAATVTSTSPTVRSGRDDITASDDAGVLGNAIAAAAGQVPSITTSTIAPTEKGWSIFGVLWYWWLVVIGLFFGSWILIKRFVISRMPAGNR